MKPVAELLRDLRNVGHTDAQIAAACGYQSPSSVTSLRNGKTKTTSSDKYVLIDAMHARALPRGALRKFKQRAMFHVLNMVSIVTGR